VPDATMNNSEKRIWEAMFVKRYHDTVYTDWFEHFMAHASERKIQTTVGAVMLDAAECATVMVTDFRSKKFDRALRKKFGKNSKMLAMYRAVRDNKNNPD
jgi:hypothetical protein